MLKNLIISISAIAMLISSTSAFALFDGEFRYGTRWYESEDSDGEKNGAAYDGLTLSGHLGLIPFVGTGLSLSTFNAKDRDISGTVKGSTLTEIGIDILINPPIPFLFGRVNLPVLSTAEITGTTDDYNNGSVTVEGYDYTVIQQTAAIGDFILSAGVQYSVIPLIAITAEASHAVVMQKTLTVTSDGDETTSDDGAKGVTMQSVMFGVRAGF
jgi:hypothetical protein